MAYRNEQPPNGFSTWLATSGLATLIRPGLAPRWCLHLLGCCPSGRTVTDVISGWWHPAVAAMTLVQDIGYMRNPLTTARDGKAGAR